MINLVTNEPTCTYDFRMLNDFFLKKYKCDQPIADGHIDTAKHIDILSIDYTSLHFWLKFQHLNRIMSNIRILLTWIVL
jgi:hypothetical protein